MSEAAPPATGQTMPLYEVLLRLCAAEAPKPWYPRAFARSAVLPQQVLYIYLENLWLDGLVQKAEGTLETGPGLTLTPLGHEVLDDPAALQRLREGRPVVEGSRGGIVREAVRRPPRPTVTYGLVGVNVAVFAYGLLLALSNGVRVEAYLMPSARAFPLAIYDKLGALLQGDALVRGEWWRLATSCFVHFGILHFLFAMIALYRIGARTEQLWGAWRVCLIYLLSGIGGNCVSVALQPLFVMPGAWAAIYGLLGATAVWVVCNDRCLPRAVATRMRANVALDAVMLLLYFMFNYFGRWHDLGGAAVGAAVGLVFQAQRFGPSPWRWAALAALVPLPWLGYTFINHERATNPDWAAVNARVAAVGINNAAETKEFTQGYLKRIRQTTHEAAQAYHDAEALLTEAPGDRDADAVSKAKQAMHDQRESVETLAKDLAAAGPYSDGDVEEARQTAAEYTQALASLLGLAERRLREGDPWDAEDQKSADKVKDLREAWSKLVSNP